MTCKKHCIRHRTRMRESWIYWRYVIILQGWLVMGRSTKPQSDWSWSQQKTPTFQQGFGMKLKGRTTCNLYETSSVSLYTNHIILLCICQWDGVLKSMPIQGTFCWFVAAWYWHRTGSIVKDLAQPKTPRSIEQGINGLFSFPVLIISHI